MTMPLSVNMDGEFGHGFAIQLSVPLPEFHLLKDFSIIFCLLVIFDGKVA